MSRKKTTASELRVGILVIAAVIILIVFILSVSGDISIFAPQMRMRTRLAAAEGLKRGDEVRLAGKRVGKVDRVDFGQNIPTDPNQKSIVVTMSFSAADVRERIRTDSVAVLGQQGFLGDRIIDITPGTVRGEPLGDGAEIQSADQASLAQVFQGASDVLVQFNSVGKQLQELMDNINKGQGTVGKLLHDDAVYVNLNRTVLEAQDLVKKVGSGTGTLGQLVNDPKLYADMRSVTTDLQGVVADLRAGKGTAGKFLKDEQVYNRASEALAKANDAIEKLGRVAGDIDSGKGTIGKLIKDDKLHSDLQETIASLRKVGEGLEKGEGSAGKFLHDDKLYNSVNQMSSEVVKLLYDFRQSPKKYLSVKISLF